jgi:hypothetical protein
MQKELARLLVRLVSHGLPIWITTHGDTFFQQMSNLVKASELNAGILETLSLEREETLSPGKVSAFYFERDVSEEGMGKTHIHSLPVDTEGIAGTAFGESLFSLTEETLLLMDSVEPKESCHEN